MRNKKLIGMIITAVAFGFAVAPVTSALAKGQVNRNTVRCYINPCKGTDCKVADNSKGQEYKLVASKETCKMAGGSTSSHS